MTINPLNGLFQSNHPIYKDRIGRLHEYHEGYNSLPPHVLLGFASLPGEKQAKTTRFFGIELEVFPRRSKISLEAAVKKVYETLPGFAIASKDGSVPGGFEIISAPATLGAHRVAWEKFFEPKRGKGGQPERSSESLASKLKSYSTTFCGMHIHVSKASLTPLLIRRLWTFINTNMSNELLTSIAGRPLEKNSVYAGKKAKELGFFGKSNYCVLVSPDKFNAASSPRHAALNITPRDTVEFRLFRGNTNYVGFMKNLDAVASFIDYCEESAAPTPLEYMKWLYKSNNPYGFLRMWMDKYKVSIERATTTYIEALAKRRSTPRRLDDYPVKPPKGLCEDQYCPTCMSQRAAFTAKRKAWLNFEDVEEENF